MEIYKAHLNIKDKKVSSVELVTDCINKAKAQKNNTYISIVEDQALIEAQKQDELIKKDGLINPLQGIPYSLKDLFITKDLRTTAGSKMLYNYIPPYDGYISEQLKKAGGVLVGKVGCDEFGMGSTNENTPYGPILNPINASYVAGGSSGGSASSVAEGSAFFSIGTDTGGSIRLPASFCGLVGFKPTYGRVSRYGQIAYASSLDQSSPIAKTVLDIACIMDSITEHDYRDTTNAPLAKMNSVEELLKLPTNYLNNKIIAYTPSFIDACQPEVSQSLKEALKEFEKDGAKLKEIEMPHLKYSVPTYYIIATSEASSNLARFDGIHYGYRKSHKGDLDDTYKKSRTEGFGEEVKRRILIGTFSLSSGYYDAYFLKACRVRRLIYNDFQNVFKNCDFYFSPVCASGAFPLNYKTENAYQMYMNDLYTIPVNLAGLPGMALPFGNAKNNLPTGFQLIANRFADLDLLKVGHSFQQKVGVKV